MASGNYPNGGRVHEAAPSMVTPAIAHSPFDALPVELVLAIMSYGIQSVNFKEARRCLTVILLTCRRFYHIAIGNPTFWTTAFISFEGRRVLDLNRQVSWAGTLPLDMILDLRTFPVFHVRTARTAFECQSLVQQTVASAERWVSLDVSFPTPWRDKRCDFMFIFHHNFPTLRTMRLSSSRRQDLCVGLPYWSLRSLRELTLVHTVPDWSKVSGFDRLEVLNVIDSLSLLTSPKNVLYFLECIADCENLRDLSIQQINVTKKAWLAYGSLDAEPVELPCLERLFFSHGVDGPVAEYICSLIEMPKIQRAIVGDWSETTFRIGSIASPSLLEFERLSVQTVAFDVDDAIEPFFSRSPHLLHLEVCIILEPCRVFGTLPTSLSGHDPLCPNLQSLTTSNVSLGEIRKFVEGRVGRILEVNIAFEDVATMSKSGGQQDLAEYEEKEWDLCWLFSRVRLLRLYEVEPDGVVVHIKGVYPWKMEEKAKQLLPLCDFEWRSWI